ncbi:MAG: coenzyme F420-0:L-glutamate ligase, partial [Methanobrevibacter sp.]|nr:coenzyme F420-0:L-glutamate ligase [Methanobrevibacter sp.]
MMNSIDNIKHTEIDNYYVIPIETGYIKPNESLDVIIEPAKEIMEDGDYLVIAETPIAISQGRLVDESEYTPGLRA